MKLEFTKRFFEYIDEHLTREEVAKSLGNSTKTLSSWRSIGIPDGKIYAAEALMKAHQHSLDSPTNVIVMKPTYEQFQSWNTCALQTGKTIEDWAFEGLEKMAAAHFAKRDTIPYDFTKRIEPGVAAELPPALQAELAKVMAPPAADQASGKVK